MKHRLAVILPIYFVTYGVCYYGAFLLRFEFQPPHEHQNLYWNSLPFVLLLKFAACLAVGEWQRTYRYTTLTDMLYTVGGTAVAAMLLCAANVVIFPHEPIPRSVIFIDGMLTILAVGMLRSGIRFYSETHRFGSAKPKRTLIYGSTRAGIALWRALQATNGEYRVVGFVHDECPSRNCLIAGIPLFSLQKVSWKKLARKQGARHVLIPGCVPGKYVREILDTCSEAGLKVHVIPAVDEIVDGRYRFSIRDVTISDLLRREPAQLDLNRIRQYVSNQRVLVTGAAGSIGSELCRQILALKPESLVFVDHSELGMFTIEQEVKDRVPEDVSLKFVLADVTDRDTMARILCVHRPDLVFHAAAYKHVPLMEENPQVAIRNNVIGTKHMVDLADQYRVKQFVLISTDKAVRPTSVMGSTKLVAEKYVQAASTRSTTRFLTVRFGNVLNSAGSVVPTFRKQIEAGGPITVTHPDIERFFMTIPEAVQLVLAAGAAGSSGDVLILDMGEPIKIVDLARDMIALSGLKYPEDIDIRFTGLRPGEKLYEELFYDSEEGTKKVHDKIYRASRQAPEFSKINREIAHLEAAVGQSGPEAEQLLKEIVMHYVAAESPPASTSKAAA